MTYIPYISTKLLFEYTTDELATKFNDAETGVAASYINQGDYVGLTDRAIASIFENTNLTITKINSIITNDNISDSRAQEILNETDYATRDLTGAASILYAIHDDWADNKLTSRDNRATTPASILGANEFAQKFRPEWTEVAAGWGASGGELVSSADGAEIGIPSKFTTGTWEWDEKTEGTGDVCYLWFRFMWVDADNAMQFVMWGNPGTNESMLEKYVSATRTSLIKWSRDTTVMHTIKITRDADGNWEAFDDGMSKGTATDTDITTSNEIRPVAENSGPTHVDNLKVY